MKVDNPFGDFWGPESWGSVDGVPFAIWKPERVIFYAGTRLPAVEPPVVVVKTNPQVRPGQPRRTRSLLLGVHLTSEDWLSKPFKDEDSLLVVGHPDTSLPSEPMLWWETDRGWEPEAGVLGDSELREARRANAFWAQ